MRTSNPAKILLVLLQETSNIMQVKKCMWHTINSIEEGGLNTTKRLP
jgi:hypothetical protein